jgi:hypothetical protein
MGKKRRRKNDPTGRGGTRGDRFVLLDFALLDSAAYRSLSTGARALLVEFNRLYNGANNGQLFMSQRDAAKLVGVANHVTAAKYINELIDRGFIRERVKGSFSVKTRMASIYVLTQHRYNDQPATRDFKKWVPPKEQKQRVRKKTATGPRIGPILLEDWPNGCEIAA